jgi:hypothetical protein
MEVIEKEKETVKEVPAGYYCDKYCCDGYGYGRYGRYGAYGTPFASKGVGGTALGLGIAGTALGLLALNRGRGFGLFGNNVPENVNINTTMSGANGTAPTAFQAWEKECSDALALTNEMWGLKVGTMNNARAAREVDVNEKFQLWKSQIDADHSLYRSQVEADFGLYKSTRDSFDVMNAKQNQAFFDLYKGQRDNFDTLSQRISALETKQAVADAVEPWRAKVLDMRINGVAANACAAVNLEAERRCCADNKIVNYVNSTFVPQTIAEPTVGTTTHTETTYNPLCGCCGSCYGGRII